jgi:hypothetical protein
VSSLDVGEDALRRGLQARGRLDVRRRRPSGLMAALDGRLRWSVSAQPATKHFSTRRPAALRLPPPTGVSETARPRLRRSPEPARAAGARGHRAAHRTHPVGDDRASRLGPARGRGALPPRASRPLPGSLLWLEADESSAASRVGADMGGSEGAADPRPITAPVNSARLRRRPTPDANKRSARAAMRGYAHSTGVSLKTATCSASRGRPRSG